MNPVPPLKHVGTFLWHSISLSSRLVLALKEAVKNMMNNMSWDNCLSKHQCEATKHVTEKLIRKTDVHCRWESTLVPRETVCLFLMNIFTSFAPTVVLLGMYLKELKTYVHEKHCAWMFTEAFFIHDRQNGEASVRPCGKTNCGPSMGWNVIIKPFRRTVLSEVWFLVFWLATLTL